MGSPVTPSVSGRSSPPASSSHAGNSGVRVESQATGGVGVTKQEFGAGVARRSQPTTRDAGRVVAAFLDTITDTLRNGGDVAFTGFGKFQTQERKARMGVNPRNPGQKGHIPAARL